MLKDRMKRKAKQRVKKEVKTQARKTVRQAASKDGSPKVLKAAAAGGAGYYAGKKVSASQSQAHAASPAPAGGSDTVTQLQQLSQLHESGALTDEEFASAKQRLLAG